MSAPQLPPDPDADIGDLIHALLLAGVCLAIVFAVVMLAPHK